MGNFTEEVFTGGKFRGEIFPFSWKFSCEIFPIEGAVLREGILLRVQIFRGTFFQFRKGNFRGGGEESILGGIFRLPFNSTTAISCGEPTNIVKKT